MPMQILDPTHPVNQRVAPAVNVDHMAAARRLAGCVRQPDGSLSLAGIEAGTGAQYNVPVVSAGDKKRTARLFQIIDRRRYNKLRAGWGTSIPWNDDWWSIVPVGRDGTIIIADETTGEWWELWKVERDVFINRFLWDNLVNGYLATSKANRICVFDAHYHPDIRTMKFDPRRSGRPGELDADIRGCGLPKVGKLHLHELDAADIRHAIALTVCNTGPGFVPGTATRSEWEIGVAAGHDIGNGNVRRLDALKSGERFLFDWDAFAAALTAPGALLDAWLACSDVERRTWDVLAAAFHDYGVFAAETCGWGAHIETSWCKADAVKWERHGVRTADRNAPLNRLFTAALRTPELWRVAAASVL